MKKREKIIISLFLLTTIFLICENIVYGELLQSFNGSECNQVSFGHPSVQKGWESYITNSSYTITNIDIAFKKVNSPTNDITLYIYDVNSNLPNTLLATSINTINGNNISSSYDYYNFTFNNFIVNDTTQYILLLNTNSYDSSNYYNLGGGCPNGSEITGYDTSIASSEFIPQLNVYGEYNVSNNISICQELNIENIYFKLNNSVSINNQNCFNITANNITIDCDGYKILGNNYSDTTIYGIRSIMNDTTIKNCYINGFHTSIGIYNYTDNYEQSVYNINIINNTILSQVTGGTGLELRYIKNSIINNNYILSRTADSLFIVGETDNLNITNNTIFGNEFTISFYGLPSIQYTHNNTLIKNNYLQIGSTFGAGISYVGIFDKSTNHDTTIINNIINATGNNKPCLKTNIGSSNTIFLNNTCIGQYWIDNSELDTIFNTSTNGNNYYLDNGSIASELFEWIDNNNDGYADIGNDLPVNSSNNPYYWNGVGEDYHPLTNTKINITSIEINITACGDYDYNNTVLNIAIAQENISGSCLNLNLNNVTVSCLNNIVGDGSGIFATIEYMNNSIIQDCNISNFAQIFLIPELTFIGYGENNIFRYIDMTQFSSAGFGFDIRTGYDQYLNHTEIYDINIINSVDNYAVSMYGDGIEDMFMHDINIYTSYSGMFFGLTKKLFINNYYFNQGTIYGLYLYGINNATIENSELINTPNCMINVDYSYDIYYHNVINDINDVALFAVKYCSGEGPSSIDPYSSYNLGWFPQDYTQSYFTDINNIALYNTTKSYDVIGGILAANHTKSYFIFPECQSIWSKQIEACINGVSIINYKDLLNCETLITLPINNGTNELCNILTTTNITFDKNIIIPIVFVTLIVIFIVLGIFIPLSFGLTIAGILSILFAFIGKQYSPEGMETILFWIFIGIGISLVTIGVLYAGKYASED